MLKFFIENWGSLEPILWALGVTVTFCMSCYNYMQIKKSASESRKRDEEAKKLEVLREAFKKEEIRVYLLSPTRGIELPLYFNREDLLRNELMGRLGMIPRKNQEKWNFDLSEMKGLKILKKIDDVRDGRVNFLKINCSDEEFDQFDFDLI